MRRFAVPAAITTLVVAFLVLLAVGVVGTGPNNSLDSAVARGHYLPAPDASARLPLLDPASGQDSLAQFRGHVVLVNVFASWCEPCQSEAPMIERAQHLLAAHGGTVLGVTYQDNATADLGFVSQYHLSYPVVRDVSGDFAQAYGVSGVPENFVVDAAGKVTALYRGPVSERWIDSALSKALHQQA